MNSSALLSAEDRALTASVWKWRVVDIVMASIIAVACAVLFIAWNFSYEVPSGLLKPLLPGLQGLLAGPWLIAGVLAGLIVRKPGAALFAEVVAASISALAGNQWQALTLVSGLVQGLGAEIVFLIVLYRVYKLPIAILAGAAAGLGAGILDRFLWYGAMDNAFAVTYITSTTISGAVIAGLGSWLIMKGLGKAGALSRFAAGREVSQRV